jgi:hypothetical protein
MPPLPSSRKRPIQADFVTGLILAALRLRQIARREFELRQCIQRIVGLDLRSAQEQRLKDVA